MGTYEGSRLQRVRRNPWWLLLGGSPWIVGLGLVVAAFASHTYALLAPLFHLLIFGLVGFFWAWRRNKSPRVATGKLTIDDAEVRFDGELVCRRDEIRSGMIVPKDGGLFVRLDRKGLKPACWLKADSEADGRAALVALGLDASQSAAEVRALSPYFSLPPWLQFAISFFPAVVGGGAMAVTSAVRPGLAPLGALGFVATMLTFVVLIMWPSRLSIGADGIFQRWIWRRRFFPFSDMTRVDPVERGMMNRRYLGLEIGHKDGRTTYLPIGQKRWAEEEFDAAVERVREAIGVYAAGVAGVAASALARAGREPRDWITALRRIGQGAEADLRTAPVRADDLVRIAADPSAAASARVSAAVALASSKSGDVERVRVAAEAAAEPKLRVALTKALSPDTSEDELATLLGELEADEAAQAKASAPG